MQQCIVFSSSRPAQSDSRGNIYFFLYIYCLACFTPRLPNRDDACILHLSFTSSCMFLQSARRIAADSRLRSNSSAGLLLLDRGDKTAIINLEAVFTVVMRQQPLGRIHNGLGGVATRELPKEDVLRHDVLQT